MNISFDELIRRLSASDIVEGIALFGSQRSAISDYDLLLVVKTLPVPIFQMFTTIEQNMADVIFVQMETVNTVLELETAVHPYSPEGMLLHKMQKATILYDGTGKLKDVQRRASHHPDLLEKLQDTYSGWFWHNHSLMHMKRMSQSADPIYQMAVALMLMTVLAEISRVYFQMRGIIWEGEKAALRYFQAHDKDFFEGLLEALSASTTAHRLAAYEHLLDIAVGNVWGGDISAVYLREVAHTPENLDRALMFWEQLVGNGHANPESNRP